MSAHITPLNISFTIYNTPTTSPVTLGNEKALQNSTLCISHQMLSVSSACLTLIVSCKLILHPAAVVCSTIATAKQTPNSTALHSAATQPHRAAWRCKHLYTSIKWGNPRCAASSLLHAWPKRTSAEWSVQDDAPSWCLRAVLDDTAHSSWPVGGGQHSHRPERKS